MNRAAESAPEFTQKQGQYLAFIDAYTLVNGRPPAQADIQRFFRVTPPTVHQMLLTLEKAQLISLGPGDDDEGAPAVACGHTNWCIPQLR